MVVKVMELVVMALVTVATKDEDRQESCIYCICLVLGTIVGQHFSPLLLTL